MVRSLLTLRSLQEVCQYLGYEYGEVAALYDRTLLVLRPARPRPTDITFVSHLPQLSLQGSASATASESDALLLEGFMDGLGGCDLPAVLFERIRQPRKRWNEKGELIALAWNSLGFESQVGQVLQSQKRTDAAIQLLAGKGLVHTSCTNDGTRYYIPTSGRTHTAEEDDPAVARDEHSILEALEIICHCIPVERDQEPQSVSIRRPSNIALMRYRYAQTVKLLIPVVEHFIPRIKSLVMPSRLTDELVETLLAASAVDTIESAWHLLRTATVLLSGASPFYHIAEIAHRRSALLRLSGDISSSEISIVDFWRTNLAQPDCARTNAAYGWLHISHLENLVQSQDVESARDQMFKWSMPERATEKELRITPARSILIAKVFRCQGQSDQALITLQHCLPYARQYYHQAICAIADALIELDRSEEACTILEQELRKLNARQSKISRRLTVSMVDAKVRLGQHDVAIKMVESLVPFFDRIGNLDTIDQLLHVRALVARALICRAQEDTAANVAAWKAVLHATEQYNSFRPQGLTSGIANLFLSLLYVGQGDLEAARRCFITARGILEEDGTDRWIPKLREASASATRELTSLTGWRMQIAGHDT